MRITTPDRRRGRARVLTLVLAALLASGSSAQALNFKAVPPNDPTILVIYDCGLLLADAACDGADESRRGFDAADGARARAAFARYPRVREVWLLSGGGLLNAGIELATLLRQRSMTARVPNHARLRTMNLAWDTRQAAEPYCVSSCTVAFMGGQFRFIDTAPGDAATYEVHAGSSVAWNGGSTTSAGLGEDVARLVGSPAVRLEAIAQLGEKWQTARDLFRVFQEALWLPLRPSEAERLQRDRVLASVPANARLFDYPAARRLRDDALIELEGRGALQDILMRVEREGMQRAIDRLRTLNGLGRRADAAIAMLAAMYQTSGILATNTMNRDTLIRMGYITELAVEP